MKNFKLLLILHFVLQSCSPEMEVTQSAKWIEGSWERNFNEVVQIENWTQTSSGFSGRNLFVTGEDTILMHTLLLKKNDQNWELQKAVAGEDIIETFRLVSASSHSLVFENTENFWPQTIIYQNLSSSKLNRIEQGEMNGMKNKMEFLMHKN